VVRISGPASRRIALSILGEVPEPRRAHFASFRGEHGDVIDQGIALYFAGPHSYTGEDVLELQGHGGTIVMQQLLRRCVESGARIAEPGEFTRRAFLNDRIDLAQAESVADLIDASSAEAARSAARSLVGEFSQRVRALVEGLTELRAHVEACIDFPDEEIDPADRATQARKLESLRDALARLMDEARQGAILREGLSVVLIGRPNVGKSSLLNRLAGDEVAIVTAIAGTTRDYVRATIGIEGVPIHLIDTAGLREARDEVERLGIERTWRAIEQAGAGLVISSPDVDHGAEEPWLDRLPPGMPVAHVRNKIDLDHGSPGARAAADGVVIGVSAKTGAGIDALRAWLLEVAGWKPHGEGLFMARERHLVALASAEGRLLAATYSQAFEIMAEELRLAQRDLSTITGEFSADDLLGEIFGRFCIGK